MAEVHITLVEQGDFAAFQVGAQFARPLVVVLGGGVHTKHACVARLTFLKPSLADAEKDQTSVKPSA
jgi:hypothetical protein